MKDSLNPTIIAYVEASNTRDSQALSRCFAPNAVVRDEGQTYEGADGVSRWIAHSLAAFVFSIEPIAVARHEDETVVTGRLTGTFPGSPVDLRFIFRLDGDKIASLEITP